MFDHVSSSAYPDLIQGGPLWWRMKNQTLDSRVLCSRPVTAQRATQSRFWPYVEFGTSRIMFWAVSLFFVIICCMLLFSVSATTQFSHIFFLVLGFLFHPCISPMVQRVLQRASEEPSWTGTVPASSLTSVMTSSCSGAKSRKLPRCFLAWFAQIRSFALKQRGWP